MSLSIQSKLLLVGGFIASCAAIWHLLCIIGGPSWYAFARAPQEIIDSAKQGTWLAPLGAIFIALLMFTCSLYALSATKLIKKIPLIKTALTVIASLCLIRGAIVIPYFLKHGFNTWDFIAGTTWFFVGICYLVGSIEVFKNKAANLNTHTLQG